MRTAGLLLLVVLWAALVVLLALVGFFLTLDFDNPPSAGSLLTGRLLIVLAALVSLALPVAWRARARPLVALVALLGTAGAVACGVVLLETLEG